MLLYTRTFFLLAATALAFAGCSGKPADTGGETGETTGHAHAHPSKGPHKGDLIELGNDEYHAEMLDDHATHTITIYILDESATKEVAINSDAATLNAVVGGEPKQFPLEAVSPVDGKASQFEVTDEDLLDALEEEGATAKLNVTIEGKPFVGTIEHHEH